MGTRSRIGIQMEDGTIRSIYCHWDGYLDHNGRILLESYKTKDKVLELIGLGDISSLDENPGTPPKGHTFDSEVGGFVVAYHRDRGEPWEQVKPSVIKSLEEWQGEEYGYLFNTKTKKWRFVGGDVEDWTPLTKAAIAKENS